MNFQSLVRLFHFRHFKNTGQNISEVLVLPVREFEIPFSLWQQYSETWITLKSVASRAAGGRLCTNSKAPVMSDVFNNCQINKKINEICICLRTENLACWNLIPLPPPPPVQEMDFPIWDFLSFISESCYICQTFHFEMNAWFFFCLCMLQEHQVVNQQKYKMRQDRWSATMIVILFLFYNPFFSSSNYSDLKMAILVYTVETDGKHRYSEGKSSLVQSNPLCHDFWWPHPFESTGTIQVDNETVGDCCYELCECQSDVNEMKIYFFLFVFLNFCFRINTFQLMSCSHDS